MTVCIDTNTLVQARAHADYVISDDRHFAPLADAGYKTQPIRPLDFIARYGNLYL